MYSDLCSKSAEHLPTLEEDVLSESETKSSASDDAIDSFFSKMGRFPKSPLELVQFSNTSERLLPMDVESATKVYRQKSTAKYLSASVAAATDEDATDELVEYFSVAASVEAPFRVPQLVDEKLDTATLDSMLRHVSMSASDESPAFAEYLVDRRFQFVGRTPFVTTDASALLVQSGTRINGDSVICDLTEKKSDDTFVPVTVKPMAVSSSATVKHVAAHCIPLDVFLKEKCTEETTDSTVYGDALLLFIERLGVSKLKVLNAIERTVDEMEDATAKMVLVNLVRQWYAEYPEDFEGDAAMRRMRFDVLKKFPAIKHLSLASKTSGSPKKTAAHRRSEDSKLKNPGTGEWISIAKRQIMEKLPVSYLCTNDKLIIKHKKHAAEGHSERYRPKRTFRKWARGKELVASKLKRKSLLDDTPTIHWLSEMPIWALASVKLRAKRRHRAKRRCTTLPLVVSVVASKTTGTCALKSAVPRTEVRERSGARFGRSASIGSGVRQSVAASDRRADEWDAKWPHLTLYFAHDFPSNLSSVELHPRDVANAWTALKLRIFRKIKPREFANKGWTKGKTECTSPNVRHMIEQFEAESKWAQMVLVSERNTSVRAFKLKRLIKIVFECIALGNLDTACAIRSGIFKRHVAALPMEELNAKYFPKLQQLMDLDDARHIGAKKFMKGRMAAGKPLLPLLVVYLDKLYRIEEVWKPRDECGNLHVRWLKGMQDTVCEVLSAQLSGFGIAEKRDIELLLIGELKRHCGMSEEQIERKAEAIYEVLPRTRRSVKLKTSSALSEVLGSG